MVITVPLQCVSHLPRLQVILRVQQLRQELQQPLAELLLTGEDLGHEVGLLETRGEEVISTGLIAKRTPPGESGGAICSK